VKVTMVLSAIEQWGR